MPRFLGVEPTVFEGYSFLTPVQDGKDSYCKVVAHNDAPVVFRNCSFSSSAVEWAMKLSLAFDVTFEDCTFSDGTERALDQVRGGWITFRRCKFLPSAARPRVTSRWALRKECDVGLKAGVHDVLFEDCSLNDLLLGDYSIYNQVARPKTRRITLRRCINPNGGPIFVRGRHFHASSLVAEDTKVSALTWPGPVTGLYFSWCRRFGDTRVLTPDQSVLQPGESDT